MKLLSVFALAVLATGCASITNDTSHPMKLETLTKSGETVKGAECKLTNDYGVIPAKSGDTVMVRRSSKDLDINCVSAGQTDANGRAISRGNAGMAGNIIFGGGIGAIIDHNKGTAYTYPTWIQMVFGDTLIFDRREEKEGTPLKGAAPEAKK